MTTIVYDHKNKQIACDSRESAEGYLCRDDAKKFYQDKDRMWFICGDKGDAREFIDNFEKKRKYTKEYFMFWNIRRGW